ncbi:hypothetical protein [Streptacidiphilus sp. PAMC 29251]
MISITEPTIRQVAFWCDAMGFDDPLANLARTQEPIAVTNKVRFSRSAIL